MHIKRFTVSVLSDSIMTHIDRGKKDGDNIQKCSFCSDALEREWHEYNTILNISAYCKVEKNFPSSKIHFQYLLCLPFHLMTHSLKFWQQSVRYANVGQIDSSFRPTCIRFILPKGNPKLYFGIPMWKSSKMRWKHTQGAIRVSCW